MIDAAKARELKRLSKFDIPQHVWDGITQEATGGGSNYHWKVPDWYADEYQKALQSLGFHVDQVMDDVPDSEYIVLYISW